MCWFLVLKALQLIVCLILRGGSILSLVSHGSKHVSVFLTFSTDDALGLIRGQAEWPWKKVSHGV